MRRRLFILVLLAVIPLAAVLGYTLFSFYQHLERDALSTANRDAGRLASNMDHFILGVVNQATAVGLAIAQNDLTPSQANAYFATLSKQIPVSDYLYVDEQGRVDASTLPSLRGLDLSTDLAVRAVLAGAPRAVTNVRTLPTGEQGFIVYAPIRLHGRVVAATGFLVGASDVAVAIPDRPPGATVVLTDRTGALIYSDEESVVAARNRLATYPPIRAALRGRAIVTRNAKVPGLDEEQVGAQVPVRRLGWTAGYYLPREQALSDITRELTLASAVVLIVLALVLLAAQRYGTAITTPLTELTAAANQVRRGRFDAPLPPGAPDEIGQLTEDFRRMQQSLAHTFNDVATLTEAGGRINSSLEVDTILQAAFRYVREVLDASVVVATLTNESVRGSEVHADGARRAQAEALSDAVRTAYPQRSLYGVDHVLVDLAIDRPQGLPWVPGDPRFLVVFPMSVRSRHIGRLDAYCSPKASEAEFLRSAIPLGISVTRQLAIALANARLFERQQLIADTLQDSLLSEPYPIEGLDVEVLYRAATVGARIGGDFFDFIPVGERAMAIVLGDISGKGIEAARYTAIAKGAIRTLAYEDAWPTSVLQRASHVIAEQTPPETFVTAVYVLLDADTGRVHYANAGHPPPLLLRKSGDIQSLLGASAPLGISDYWTPDEGEAQLEEGDRLLLFTDGLTEARHGHVLFGSEGVARAAVELREAPLHDLPGQLVLQAARHAHGRLADDVAVVAVERTGVRGTAEPVVTTSGSHSPVTS